ncbi:MAG TPA: ABC transporter permease, partial [Myxococcaceae bacterium]|nr:ABC transporter permease [Myxococcaceae bacterium]
MQSAERQTVYRWGFVWSGVAVALLGAIVLGMAVSRSQAWGEVSSALGLGLLGWGSAVQTLNAALLTPVQLAMTEPLPIPGSRLLLVGTLIWLGGWVLIAAGVRRAPAPAEGPSPAAGAAL